MNVTEPPEKVLLIDYQEASPSEASVKLNWSTPSHLEVTYNGHGVIDSHVATHGGIDISVRTATPRG
jgi:hypothetical protein